jgi:hypothetical protein
MKHRKLRSAWSVAWGVVAVLLIALWARSYWRLEILEKSIGFEAIQLSSVKGRIAIGQIDRRAALGRSYLSVVAGDAADWRKGRGALGFAHYDNSSLKALVAPHWLPALLSAALAVVPWFSRSWRFSLRTLLLATTAVAVALGLIIYTTRG